MKEDRKNLTITSEPVSPYDEARAKFRRAQAAYKHACAEMRLADDELARSRGLPR
jgi:hypothetical protein